MKKVRLLMLFLISTILGTSKGEEGEEKLVLMGELISCENGVNGTVYAKNKREIVLKDFTYDTKKWAGDGVRFMGMLEGATAVVPAGGIHDGNYSIPFPPLACHVLDHQTTKASWTNERQDLILPVSILEYETFGLYAFATCTSLAHLRLPKKELSSLPEAPDGLEVVKICFGGDKDRYGDEQKANHKPCTRANSKHSAIDSCEQAPAGQTLPKPNLTMVMVIVGVTYFGLISKNTPT